MYQDEKMFLNVKTGMVELMEAIRKSNMSVDMKMRSAELIGFHNGVKYNV